ncbi:hypothetical protein IMZ48_02525 [Candidatus Bathyarchaeota archaeon]|nr:hypothetical protein [Candidatus Bathyarchaeota archaeon]
MVRRLEFKRLDAMGRLLGCMFLTMLHKLERETQLSPDSDAKNLGLIMGLNMQLFVKLNESYGLLQKLDDLTDEERPDTKVGGFLKLNGSILVYATKHNVVIKGDKGIEDAVKQVADLSDAAKAESEIPGGDDPWGWEDEYKRYVDGSPDQIIGGDRWDITTWTPERRRKFVFDTKDPEDPLDSATIEAIEDGHAMQMT